MEFYYRMFDDCSYCITYYKGNTNQVIIPERLNVTILFDGLFKGHTEITSVNIPTSITDIGGFVFDGCSNLRTLQLPSNLANMWQYALTRCGIESIIIPGSVTSIVPFTFYQCKKLKTVRFSEGTKRICSWAFKDCIELHDVYLSSSIMDISNDAFDGCENVTLHNPKEFRLRNSAL